MNSLGEECTPLKHEYDTCFHHWFREKYLKGDVQDTCADLFKKYQTCLKAAMAEQEIDITQIETEVLGTPREKSIPEEKDS